MAGMAFLFRNKNVFYETESEAYLHRVFDADDKARISILQQNGWKLTYTAINGVFTTACKEILQHWSGNRPLLSMMAPWVIEGDINSGNQAVYFYIRSSYLGADLFKTNTHFLLYLNLSI